MADSLTDLQSAAQGSTLDDIKSNTGVVPTNPATAQSLNAKPNSAQMAGTPNQSAAALKESLSPKSSLSELLRTATGRVEAKKGQSTSAMESLENAKALSGLAGKVGAALTNVVSNAKLPLDVSANLDNVPDADKAKVAEAAAELLEANRAGGDLMPSYEKLKEMHYDVNQIAGLFNVDPATLWGKIESSLPAGVKVSDLAGIADEGQLNTVRNMLSDEERAGFEKLSWTEAKAIINKKLDDSLTNVNDLKRQAADGTLPESTRALAVQRLRELGQTGEYQAVDTVEAAQRVVEDADNVYIDGQAYEVSDVLQSPEAKALVSDILTGVKDISALKGTPFEGLTDLVTKRSAELGKYFGIKDGQLQAHMGNLAAVEAQRKTNEEVIKSFLRDKGLTITTDMNVLTALGIKEDVLDGYASFDPAVVDAHPVLKSVLNITDPTRRARAIAALAVPGASAVINDGSQVMIDLLSSDPVTAENLIKASNISKDTTQVDTQEEMNTLWKDLGLDMSTIDSLGKLSNVNVNAYGIKLPAALDANADGKIDDTAQLAKNVQGKTPEEIHAILKGINSVDINKIAVQKKTDDDLNQLYLVKPTQGVAGLKTNIPSIKDLEGSFTMNPDGTMQLGPSWRIPSNQFQATPAQTSGLFNSLYAVKSEVAKALKTAKDQKMSYPAYAALEASYAPLLNMVRQMDKIATNRAEDRQRFKNAEIAAKRAKQEEERERAWENNNKLNTGQN